MAALNRPQPRRGPSGGWARMKPPDVDPLEIYGFPSKGETKLHDYSNQEAFYQKIVERYMKFIAASGGGEELEKAFATLAIQDSLPHKVIQSKDGRPPIPRQVSSTPRPNDMSNILMAMRKLREGILGSKRRDQFAQRAYMFLIQASILARHWESYHPALSYLLDVIHPITPLAPPELHDFVGYRVLDLACRQYELDEAFAVRHQYRMDDRRLNVVLHSIVHDDWVQFWRVKRAVDGYQRAILEFAVDRMRVQALKSVGMSYLNADKKYIERCGDASWSELVKGGVGWELQESGSVIIRRPKVKAKQ